MRESIGGTWIVGIVIVFIVIFTGYLALSVNYSKAFKVKNGIISIIEENEGLTDKAQEQIIKYLNSTGYYVYGSCSKIDTDYVGNEEAINGVLTGYERQGTTDKYKYCVFERTVENDALNRKYYRVTVFFKFDIPLLDNAFTFPVTGETKAVYFAE
mgnify:FL=1